MGAAPRGRSRSRSRSRAAAGCPGPPRSPAGEGDAKALLHSLAQQSFDHRDFANPKAETCWLSCLFQALWHSVAFHAAFEAFLAPARCAAGGAGSLLEALQQTWASYKQEAGADGGEAAGERRLVPPQKLAEAFGEGYGDMSDALSAILQELSRSQDTGARAVSDILAVVPVPTEADDLPTPGLAWRQLEQWQATAAPLVAVDLSFDRLPPDDSEKLAPGGQRQGLDARNSGGKKTHRHN
ncbi:unnamed protein product [Prorocentrum cordatum]|uniref:Uncharacterized protein n=1 Tax=Prorocentrum cordatum TaxID=2364126 RepID=A0ABN9UK66_9DINO|nr:unnamed protein product [Polarella glacialis]